MKKAILYIITNIVIIAGWAQALGTDSIIRGNVTITKDSRIDLLGKKMADYNESLANKIHLVKGYRLTLLSTTDRNQAIQIRSQLLQQYPDQSVYMTFQSPYIRLKFGNFIERDDAEQMRKELISTK
ncbi:MAG: SPOR domain-containing protein, partial [Ferruginibacter sp.]